MSAELTHDRKRVRCNGTTPSGGRCFRVLAWRVRRDDGSHILMTYNDWRPIGSGYVDGVWRDAERYERAWQRREEGHQSAHSGKGKSAMAWSSTALVPVTTPGPFRCGCRADVIFDPVETDAIIGPEAMGLT